MVESSSNGPVDRDTPLRLADAVKIAFPLGGMTVSGLRREAAQGRLTIMRIAGKDWTTLAAIRDMLDKCRVQPKEPHVGFSRRSEADEDKLALESALALAETLKMNSKRKR